MLSSVLDRLLVGGSEPREGGEPRFTDGDLRRLGVVCVVNVGGVALSHLSVPVFTQRLVDGAGNPEWMVSTALSKVEAGLRSGRVLVTCRAGFSRSPFIALLWLERMGMSRDEAYGLLKRRHPETQINPDLLRGY